MKRLLILSALIVAAPAQATMGLICSTAGPPPVHLALAISHTAVPSVVSARLTDNRRDVSVVTAQSWFDPSEVRVDLVDRNAMRHEARLRATWRPGSHSYDGTLWRNGKKRWVRCREG
ncbi:MAG TPA: hypothetical protein VNJ05_09310 [Sphingomicrobium sp.]|nr:hypothetical protein [Sphingomicrobium sp.]